MQTLNKRCVLRFRVTDNNIITGKQKAVGNFSFCAEGLTGTRRTQNQAVGVFQQLSVHHDEVVGQSIDTVVQSFFPVLEQFLRSEGHKDSCGTGGQSSLDLNLIETQRQTAHQPFFLLEVQPGQLTVILLGNRACLKDVVAKLTGIVRCVQHQKGQKEHSLVAALQILQEFFRFTAVGSKVRWNDVHVVSGTDCFFLFLDLAAVQVGNLSLYRFDGFHLIHRLNVHTHNERAFHIQKISQQTVIQFRCENLQKRNSPVFLTHTELLAGAELKGAWCNKILCGQTGRSQPVPFKLKRELFIHVEYRMKLKKPFFTVQRSGSYTKTLEVIKYICLNTLQTGLGGFDAVRVDTKGQIFGLDETVVTSGQLILQHCGVFLADTVKGVPLGRDGNGVSKGLLRCRKVQKRQLEMNRAVKIIEEITPPLKDCRLIFVLGELIVDVLKLDGLCVVAVRYAADSVRPHPFIRDTVLRRFSFFVRAVSAGNGRFDLLLIGAGQLFLCLYRLHSFFLGFSEHPMQPFFYCGEQCHTPPYRAFPAALIRHKSCWSGKVAALDGSQLL